MATDEADHRKIEARVNRLYWESEMSVNAVAEEMGLSKGRLYELLRPLPSGLGCPRCGSELGFGNRTDRDRGQLSCPRCEFEGPRSEALPTPEEGSQMERLPRERTTGKEVMVSSTIVAGLLVGAAAGLLLGRYLRR